MPALLLSFQIASPTLLPEELSPVPRFTPRHKNRSGTIEIEFTGRVRVVLHSGVHRATRTRVIAVLSDR